MQAENGLARLRARLAANPVLTAVLAFAFVALLARLVFLGGRIAHYDEGRVAYWALNYQETGTISYRYIVHGPFVQYVDGFLFGLFGPSDAVARLPLALFGGFLPLGALLFRERLRGVEVVGVAAFLALNPVFVYYSRFLRSTLLVAGFCFLAFGCLVRAFDTRHVKYVYAASVLLALAFASKENAAVYLLVWVGATGLLVLHRLFWPWRDRRARDAVRDAVAWLVVRVRAGGRGLVRSVGGHALGVVAAFLLVSLFFYAPRNPAEGVGLWRALTHPATMPQLLDATVADVVEGYAYWFGGSTSPGCHKETVAASYVCFMGSFLETLAVAAAPLTALAVAGLALELFDRERPRPLVLFAGYWGLASVVGYPLGMDIRAGWVTINALVPLAVPAAVGLGWLLRKGWRARRDRDAVGVAIVAVVVGLLAVQAGAVATEHVYQRPAVDADENVLVQFAQPTDDYRPVLERVDAVAGDEPGPHVVVHGDALTGQHPSPVAPSCGNLRELLPMQWYLAGADLTATCPDDSAAVADGRPPLVITRNADAGLRDRLDGYVVRTYHNRATDDETVFFVRQDVAGDASLGGHEPSSAEPSTAHESK